MKYFRYACGFLILPTLIASLMIMARPILAAELVVISSDAPDIMVGAIIASGQALEIPAGKKVTLISGSGRPVNIDGPFSGIPAAGAARGDRGLAKALAQIITSKDETSENMGAVRAATGSLLPNPSLWQINATKSGKTCLLKNDITRLWRPGTRKGTKLEIKNAQTSQTAKLTWSGRHNAAIWPANLPLEDGQKYLIRVAGEMTPTAIEVKIIDKPKGNLGEKAVMLTEYGCKAQAVSLLMSIK